MQKDWFAKFKKQQQAGIDKQKQMHWDMLHRKRTKNVTLARTPDKRDIRVLTCHKCRKNIGFITLLPKSTLSPKGRTFSRPTRDLAFSQSTRDVGIFTTCLECLIKGMRSQMIEK